MLFDYMFRLWFFFYRKSLFSCGTVFRIRLHGLSKLSSLPSWKGSSPLKSKYFYTVFFFLVILISHIIIFFQPFIDFLAELNKKCRNALLFMTSHLHWKILNIFRKISSKIINMFTNIIKFYRLWKYVSDVICVNFLLILLKGGIIVWFLNNFLTLLRLRWVHTICTFKKNPISSFSFIQINW